MADFDKALAYTLRHEGGWSDDPADPGGATNFGITLKTAQKYGIRTKERLRAISQARAADVYRDGYWRHGDIEDQRVATKLFDMAVNMGHGGAAEVLACAVNGKDGPGPIFGGYGLTPGAVSYINRLEPEAFLVDLCKAAEKRYRAIVAKRPASAKFLKGWLRRAAGVPDA
jgi:lysozyme family protein